MSHKDHDGQPSTAMEAEPPCGQVTRAEPAPERPDRARRRFLAGALAVGATGLLSCRRAGDTSARKGETPPAPPRRTAPPDAPARRRSGPRPSERARARPTPRRSAARPAETRRSAPAPAGGKSRVVQVVNAKAYDAKGRPAAKPVKAMVDQAVMTLTGKGTAAAAWKSLFKPTEKVGLKPNCLGRQLCWPNPATVDAIIEGLLSAGVPYQNMIMWDMWGFGASPLSRRYRKSPMQVKHIKAWGFDRRAFKIPSGPPVKFTKALMAVDAVVNIPVIKDHDLTGVTCSLKNMAFGSIPNPWAFHADRKGVRMCDPMVPEIYALPPIKDKARLILADAFNIIIDGGPKGNVRGLRKLHSVFAATDPVAMDRVAWTLIDQERVKARLPKLDEKPLSRTRPRGRPRYVRSAEKLGLGTADPARIDHVVKRLG